MSSYCVRADLESVFGVNNIESWADLDVDGNTDNILARINAKIVLASSFVDRIFRRTFIDLARIAADVPVEIVNATAEIAGVLLHESRGVDLEKDKDEPSIEGKRDRGLSTLNAIVTGWGKLDKSYYSPAATAGRVPKVRITI